MNSENAFSGAYLKRLYTDNKDDKLLWDPDILKKLLNYELNCMGDTFDVDYNFEIIDFCTERLKILEPVDEQKMKFIGQKLAYEAEAVFRTQRRRKVCKWIAIAASLAIIVGCAAFGGVDGLAGKFEFVHRLVTEEDGEQLIAKTPDMTLSEIEMEKGHLPDHLPDNYSFQSSSKDITSVVSTYDYIFSDVDNQQLTITVRKYSDAKSVLNNEIEINEHSIDSKKLNGNTYYYSRNMEINSISWSFSNKIYLISSESDFTELDRILSLYIEEQNNDKKNFFSYLCINFIPFIFCLCFRANRRSTCKHY